MSDNRLPDDRLPDDRTPDSGLLGDKAATALAGTTPLPAGLRRLVGPYLGRQRWFAGSGEPGSLDVVDSRLLPSDVAQASLWWAVVEAEGVRYQLLIGQRPDGEPAEFLSGREGSVLGSDDGSYFYDAALDPELSLGLLAMISDGAHTAERVRPITAEQSNTSLVYDDRIILKVFRRLMDGPNPDVEVTVALASNGFEHVAHPVAAWRGSVGSSDAPVDLMFAQEFLAGASEGWALALTSLRDFYSAVVDDPAESGGDFASEAGRLGRVTARMHLSLADIYGVDHSTLAADGWARLLDDVERRLAPVLDAGAPALAERAGAVLARLRAVRDPGPAIRVHGDYHLGQVMRTDTGWYVLDFEGEPARALDDRQRASSPLKDVTGMVRSLQYAARFVLRERTDSELDRLQVRADAWEVHNREAFLLGYHSTPDIDGVLPDGEVIDAVAAAYELDKALYEVDYERAYRPDWVDIPTDAVARIVGRLSS
ncbi:phosphotransferase [Acidiferrimicrobium sp. IK]|uniref:phosphotransferase n=1 Tax=Acidiferrimicrobium sp. IK TaxID=2871700 RepID=UPI0021CB4DB4|nr:phosphotransferase [Acidiferrimicrobium sp. IK]MCU4186511.1 phosphotransferase [Acidiferrimicrobium sp. IK]